MSKPNDFYNKGQTSTEPSMRQEMINTLDGFFPEIAKGMSFMIRTMQKDENGKLKVCPCVNPVTHEPDRDTFCPICYGEGYIWSESLANGYKVLVSGNAAGVPSALMLASRKYGLSDIPFSIFYMRYSVNLTKHDRIIEISLDPEGNIVRPILRTQVWRPQEIIDFRADNGRAEFIKIFTSLEDIKWVNAPGR